MYASAVALLVVLLSCMGMAQELAPSHAPTNSHTSPASPAGDVSPTAIVARVNGVALTGTQFLEMEQLIFPYFKMHGGAIPPSAMPEIRERTIHKLVLDELIWQECKRRGMVVPPAKFQKGLSEIRTKFASSAAYKDAITKKYGSQAEFERRMKRAILVRQLWDSEVTKKSAVSNDYLRNYYLTNKKNFVRPEAVSIQSISFLFPANATAEQKQQARKKADECLPKAKAAKNYEEFGMLAEKISEDEWRVMMGDHKWVHLGEVDSQFETIFTMKPGETTGVLESKEGFHILRVTGHEQPRQMTYLEMRDKLRKQLESQGKLDRADTFEKALRKIAKIEVYL